MENELWVHSDGRTVRVHPTAKSTQGILQRAGFRRAEPEEEIEEQPRRLDLDISPMALKKLDEAGYDNVDALRAASDDELLAIKGFGKKSLEALRAQL